MTMVGGRGGMGGGRGRLSSSGTKAKPKPKPKPKPDPDPKSGRGRQRSCSPALLKNLKHVLRRRVGGFFWVFLGGFQGVCIWVLAIWLCLVVTVCGSGPRMFVFVIDGAHKQTLLSIDIFFSTDILVLPWYPCSSKRCWCVGEKCQRLFSMLPGVVSFM